MSWVQIFAETSRYVAGFLHEDFDDPADHLVGLAPGEGEYVVVDVPQALLFRAGGYWWDGATWYRPGQVWDGAADELNGGHQHRPDHRGRLLAR